MFFFSNNCAFMCDHTHTDPCYLNIHLFICSDTFGTLKRTRCPTLASLSVLVRVVCVFRSLHSNLLLLTTILLKIKKDIIRILCVSIKKMFIHDLKKKTACMFFFPPHSFKGITRCYVEWMNTTCNIWI